MQQRLSYIDRIKNRDTDQGSKAHSNILSKKHPHLPWTKMAGMRMEGCPRAFAGVEAHARRIKTC
jgi:hypothetical protein